MRKIPGGNQLSAAITAVGTVTGHGLGRERLFEALLEGRSAIGPLTRFSADGLCSNLAAEAPEDEELESAANAAASIRSFWTVPVPCA